MLSKNFIFANKNFMVPLMCRNKNGMPVHAAASVIPRAYYTLVAASSCGTGTVNPRAIIAMPGRGWRGDVDWLQDQSTVLLENHKEFDV